MLISICNILDLEQAFQCSLDCCFSNLWYQLFPRTIIYFSNLIYLLFYPQ